MPEPHTHLQGDLGPFGQVIQALLQQRLHKEGQGGCSMQLHPRTILRAAAGRRRRRRLPTRRERQRYADAPWACRGVRNPEAPAREVSGRVRGVRAGVPYGCGGGTS